MYGCSQVRPLGLFEVLTRNRQSALGLSGRSTSALVQTHRMFTIPPRQQLPITRRLVVRARRVTRAIIRIRVIPIRWYKTYARETCSKRTLEKKLVKHSHRIQISPHKRLYTQRERDTETERAKTCCTNHHCALSHTMSSSFSFPLGRSKQQHVRLLSTVLFILLLGFVLGDASSSTSSSVMMTTTTKHQRT